jgi:hypothetical protein
MQHAADRPCSQCDIEPLLELDPVKNAESEIKAYQEFSRCLKQYLNSGVCGNSLICQRMLNVEINDANRLANTYRRIYEEAKKTNGQ